jgi:hypothetical protein
MMLLCRESSDFVINITSYKKTGFLNEVDRVKPIFYKCNLIF